MQPKPSAGAEYWNGRRTLGMIGGPMRQDWLTLTMRVLSWVAFAFLIGAAVLVGWEAGWLG